MDVTAAAALAYPKMVDVAIPARGSCPTMIHASSKGMHLSISLAEGESDRNMVLPVLWGWSRAKMEDAVWLDSASGTHHGLDGSQLLLYAWLDEIRSAYGQVHAGGSICQHIQL